MKIYEVMAELENYAPTGLAEDFDNVGLLVGDKNRDVTSVLLTLDVDMGVAREAKAKGANLIVSHHPMMLDGIKKITTDTPLGRCLNYLIENKIAVYAAHTNLDSTQGGLNDILAGLIGLQNSMPLTGDMADSGLGRVGNFEAPTTIAELAQKLKSLLNLPYIRFTGSGNDEVICAAVCSGSGAGLIGEVIRAGAQVYITGDMKYHNVRDAADEGVNIIQVGHYDSEIIAPQLFRQILEPAVKTHIAETNKNIFNII